MKTLPFEYTYARLPEHFFQKMNATGFSNVKLLKWNDRLGRNLKINRDEFNSDELAQIFSGKKLQPEAQPVAQAYSGHQFAHFNPELGDGRALLLGELRDTQGELKDIHLKGSGPTQYSRRGDGRANLSAVIREYIVSEGFFGLGIPASQSLALISTGEIVQRQTAEPGAILVRVASSHVRVGTFEHFASRGDQEALKTLANYVIDRHYPELRKNAEGYLQLFKNIVQKQTDLISKWMCVGFVHGVMNTDNTFISGETLDFGPCAFMEEYDPSTVFSSIDQNGRYAYIRQPEILHWNLTNLAQCFLQFIDGDREVLKTNLTEVLSRFPHHFTEIHLKNFGLKFGLSAPVTQDFELMQGFLELLYKQKSDFTNSFRKLIEHFDKDSELPTFASAEMRQWLESWRALLKKQGLPKNDVLQMMIKANPVYIPRNHRVEEAIRFAVDRDDFSKLDRLVEVLQNPFQEKEEFTEYTLPANPEEVVNETFCNT